MANWSRSSIIGPGTGGTDPVPVGLKRDYRLPLPAEIRDEVAWLATDGKKQDVLFERNAPGRVRVIEAEVALPQLREAMAADPEAAEDLRLIYSTGGFIRDRLDLSDPAVRHLCVQREIGRDEEIPMAVRAFEGDIEIWSRAFWDEQVALAQERQQDLMDTLKRGRR